MKLFCLELVVVQVHMERHRNSYSAFKFYSQLQKKVCVLFRYRKIV